MSIYRGATYRPLNQFSNVGTMPRVGVVLHVNESQGPDHSSPSGDSLYDWIASGHDMSCHFQVSQTGKIEQYVNTDNGSWCQKYGNDDYISIETEGIHTDPLTDEQVTAVAGILAWCKAEHGIPLRLAERPGERGFGWHGMGGVDWGNHPSCPGEPRKAQRAQILFLAAGGAIEEDDMKAEDRAWMQKLMNVKFDGTIGRVQTLVSEVAALKGQLAGLTAGLALHTGGEGGITAEDLAEVTAAAEAGTKAALDNMRITVEADPDGS